MVSSSHSTALYGSVISFISFRLPSKNRDMEVAWQTTALMSRIVYFYGGGLRAVTPQKSIFCLGLVLYF